MNRPEYLKKYIHPRQSILGEYITITDANASIWSKSEKYELSKGCQSCKNGTWLCIFVGHKCNAECNYCPQGTQLEKIEKYDDPDAAQQYWIDDLIRAVRFSPKGTYTGISYSGGEPFMYLNKIIRMANEFSRIDQDIYQWVYTNGMLVTSDNMKLLADLNISEIRFHLGAFNFDNKVLSNLEKAVNIFPNVNIETPSCPETTKIFKDDLLKRLVDIGVKQINLAEMYLSRNQAKDYDTDKLYYYTSASRGFHISPIDSRISTYDLLDYAKHNKIDIIINDCSHESRDIQIMTKLQNPHRQVNID